MRRVAMKIVFWFLVVAVLLDWAGAPFMPASGEIGNIVAGLILASPIFGLFHLFFRVTRWHAGTHRRRR